MQCSNKIFFNVLIRKKTASVKRKSVIFKYNFRNFFLLQKSFNKKMKNIVINNALFSKVLLKFKL